MIKFLQIIGLIVLALVWCALVFLLPGCAARPLPVVKQDLPPPPGFVAATGARPVAKAVSNQGASTQASTLPPQPTAVTLTGDHSGIFYSFGGSLALIPQPLNDDPTNQVSLLDPWPQDYFTARRLLTWTGSVGALGYRLYSGPGPTTFDTATDLGDTNRCVLPDARRFYALTAYDDSGQESDFSEVAGGVENIGIKINLSTQ